MEKVRKRVKEIKNKLPSLSPLKRALFGHLHFQLNLYLPILLAFCNLVECSKSVLHGIIVHTLYTVDCTHVWTVRLLDLLSMSVESTR